MKDWLAIGGLAVLVLVLGVVILRTTQRIKRQAEEKVAEWRRKYEPRKKPPEGGEP